MSRGTHTSMIPAHVVEIVTPKKIVLNGLWFGPKKPTRAIVWVHGLTSSAFSKLAIVSKLTDAETAVLTFNNRGHSSVARVAKLDGTKMRVVGGAYENFEDCVDDIDGALRFAKNTGVKDVYLAGHSTGCQKSIYWAYRRQKGVKGIVLLAPMSDYAGAVKKYGLPKIRHMHAIAKSMLKSGKSQEFVHADFWRDEPNTPARFLSLYTSTSTEQSIFSYFEPDRSARIFESIRIPLLVLLAQKDEYADRSAKEILRWFETKARTKLTPYIVNNATHSFHSKTSSAVAMIRTWMNM